MKTEIRRATESDVSTILSFIRDLAEYEKLSHEVFATEAALKDTLFGLRPAAEVFLMSADGVDVAFSLSFPSYSTFLAKPGIYLEDLFVKPAYRGRGYGKQMLAHLAQIAVERGCGRLEWSVLNWNQPAIDFYLKLGSQPMDEWTVHRLTGDALKALAKSAR